MANPLYIDLGFSKTDIANITKVFGFAVGLTGIFAGGWSASRFGLMPTLLVGGIAAAASHLSLALLAHVGHDIRLLTLAICVENFAGGFAGTALVAFMSSLVSPLHAAAQYALVVLALRAAGKDSGRLFRLCRGKIRLCRVFRRHVLHRPARWRRCASRSGAHMPRKPRLARNKTLWHETAFKKQVSR